MLGSRLVQTDRPTWSPEDALSAMALLSQNSAELTCKVSTIWQLDQDNQSDDVESTSPGRLLAEGLNHVSGRNDDIHHCQ